MEDLLIRLPKLKKPQLVELAKYYKIRGYSRMNVDRLFKALEPLYNQEIARLEEIKRIEREFRKRIQQTRDVKKLQSIHKITQNPVYRGKIEIINQDEVGEISDKLANNIYDDIISQKFASRIYEILESLFKKRKDITSMIVKPFVLYSIDLLGEDGNIITKHFIGYAEPTTYEKIADFKKETREYLHNIGENTSDPIRQMIIGFKALDITLIPGKDYTNIDPRKFKAYAPTNNRKFHELTCKSTSDMQVCIYETFLILINKIKQNERINETYKYKVIEMLEDEGAEIKNNVIEGNMIQSFELLTKKYNETIYINFRDHPHLPLEIKNGITTTIKKDDTIGIKNKRIALYSKKDKHVAPAIYTEKEQKEFNKSPKTYKLIPQNLKDNSSSISHILAFDMETSSKNFEQEPYCICLYGEEIGKRKIQETFYGINKEELFVQYLISIATKKNLSKTRQTEQIKNIHIYGFNNSRFDNLLCFKHIKRLVDYAEMNFCGNSIKYIEFDNIKIFDLNLFYAGSLSRVSKSFQLPISKGVFPYKFVTPSKIHYIGKIPELKYWKSEDDMIEYQKENGDIIDIKEYTTKYCMLDCKLTYEIAKKHLLCCVGEINGRKFNVESCPTAANMSMKLFRQVFLTEDLNDTPDIVFEKEREAYKGGRTEVFKKTFMSTKDNPVLNYIDINSSYPSSMLEPMPHKYIRTNKYDGFECKLDHLTDTNLYLAKANYQGSDKYLIPNLLERDEHKCLKTSKNTDYSYHWGVELKEAIANEYKITIKEELVYETKIIFKSFAEYFYNERLKIKETNAVMSEFYKMIMNSLSGKFGQKAFNESILIEPDEIINYIKGDNILINFEEIDGKLLIEFKNNESQTESIGRLVRFISYITGHARTKLAKVMRNIRHNHIYYCDTDSIFSDKMPDTEFLDNKILGKFKLEDKIVDATFIGKKSYRYTTIDGEEVNKCKGIDADQLDYEDYLNMSKDSTKTAEATTDTFFRSLKNGVTIKPQTRTVKPIYNKRIWKGNNSSPFE